MSEIGKLFPAGQWFKVAGRDIFLKVTEVEGDTCLMKTTTQGVSLERGWEAEQR